MTWANFGDYLSTPEIVVLVTVVCLIALVMLSKSDPEVHVLTGASDHDSDREPASTVEGTPYETAARRYGMAIRLDRASDSPASQSTAVSRTANGPRLVGRIERRKAERVN